MNWDDLRFFLAACREGSSSAAARRLKVRHSTVGRRLSALEGDLGVRLFVRTGTGFATTEAGLAILAAAEEMERRALDIAQLAQSLRHGIEGKVRVTMSEAFAGYLFGKLPPLRDAHPLLQVDIVAGNRTFDLQKGEADVAVRMVPTEQPDLVSRVLGEASGSLYASRTYLQSAGRPPTPGDLAGHQVVGFDDSLAGSPGAMWLAANAAGATVALVGNSVGMVVQAADSGAGIAMIPCFLATARPNLVRLFDDLAEKRKIWLVFRRDVGEIARVRAVIDFISETIRADRALFIGSEERL